ncbi:peroxiredoxin [Pandoraea capi]|uniref:Peroxiredoxin n=1 Tax=Pandoraea capi TaxID=2508286 RepID=A0ABY6WBF1_9BURK|nr:OsmC family protein [Pandoraea capi]VVE51358.1 peroxiredoxin [Pandoraea capi]
MASGEHEYRVEVEWVGNEGSGTSGYRAYGRNHEIRADGKPSIPGSADPAFRGDAARWNPEDLLVASASACHKLWYLHLCAEAGIVVERYRDNALGTMIDTATEGRFTRIVLRPHVTIRAGGDVALAEHLHHTAHEKCYVANSVNFPIDCEPVIETIEV